MGLSDLLYNKESSILEAAGLIEQWDSILKLQLRHLIGHYALKGNYHYRDVEFQEPRCENRSDPIYHYSK